MPGSVGETKADRQSVREDIANGKDLRWFCDEPVKAGWKAKEI
jgi:hypothetical protein